MLHKDEDDAAKNNECKNVSILGERINWKA